MYGRETPQMTSLRHDWTTTSSVRTSAVDWTVTTVRMRIHHVILWLPQHCTQPRVTLLAGWCAAYKPRQFPPSSHCLRNTGFVGGMAGAGPGAASGVAPLAPPLQRMNTMSLFGAPSALMGTASELQRMFSASFPLNFTGSDDIAAGTLAGQLLSAPSSSSTVMWLCVAASAPCPRSSDPPPDRHHSNPSVCSLTAVCCVCLMYLLCLFVCLFVCLLCLLSLLSLLCLLCLVGDSQRLRLPSTPRLALPPCLRCAWTTADWVPPRSQRSMMRMRW